MTVTEVIDYVRRMHNEQNAQTPFWTDMELYGLIEAKSNEILSVVGLIEGKDTSLTTTASTADYAFPSNFIKIRRVWVNGIALKYLNFRQYESRQPQGTAPTGTPREFTIWNGTITLIPTPDTSALTITVFGEKQQSSITSASSTLDTPSVFHPAICDAVIAQMFAKDLNAGMAQFYENKWLQFHIPNMRQFAKRRQRRGLPTTVIDADSVISTELGII